MRPRVEMPAGKSMVDADIPGSVIAIRGEDENIYGRRRRVIDRPRWWWRIIVSRPFIAVIPDHLRARICSRSKPESEPDERHRNHTKFFLPHDRYPSPVSRIEPKKRRKVATSAEIGVAIERANYYTSISGPPAHGPWSSKGNLCSLFKKSGGSPVR